MDNKVNVNSHLFSYTEFASPKLEFSRDLLTGMHHTELKSLVDYETGNLVIRLNTYVLTDLAGPPAEGRVTVALPVRPWWIPKFMWKRIPTGRGTWSVKATPKWTYPSANVSVPPLGNPVRIFSFDDRGMDPNV